MTHVLVEARLHPDKLRQLQALPGVRVTTAAPTNLQSKRSVVAPDVVGDVDIFVGTLPPQNHAEMTALKFFQVATVGYSQLYGLDLVRRGVRAANARGVYDTVIAEWNVAMMINLGRDLRTMIRNQDAARWHVDDRYAHEIRGGTVGLWGYGGIGRETARLAKTLGQTVHVLTRRGIGPRDDYYAVPGTGDPAGTLPDRVFTAGQELEFLAGLDFLILSMPNTPANTGIVGERELRAMKPTAFLLNPARGPLVNEQALLKALDERWIAGAALDTHFAYPLPPEHPLWQMPHVILTPHISGSERGPHYLERFWSIILHNVENFLAGKPFWNELTPAELNGN